MFAPYQRARSLHWLDSDAAGRRRMTVGCTLGRSRSAQTAAGRTLSSASQKTRSSTTCSPGPAGTAQQMLDLQVNLQTDVPCTARMVSSNLTAGIPAAYHPWTVDGLVGGAMQGSRLTRRRGSGLEECCMLWTCYALEG